MATAEEIAAGGPKLGGHDSHAFNELLDDYFNIHPSSLPGNINNPLPPMNTFIPYYFIAEEDNDEKFGGHYRGTEDIDGTRMHKKSNSDKRIIRIAQL